MKKTLFEFLEKLKSLDLVVEYSFKEDITESLIEYISYNSMDVVPGTLFACKGAAFKKEYLDSAMEKGAICYVSEKIITEEYNYIIVNDIRESLSEIGRFYYDDSWNKNMDLIGLTGTKGKTTTTFFINSILESYCKDKGYVKPGLITGIHTYNGVKTYKSNNLTTPEPFELHKVLNTCVENGCKYLAMEVSSQALKYGRANALNYKVGAFLNMGLDHISDMEHKDFNDYFTSKLKLFKLCDTVCINEDIEEEYLPTIKEFAYRDCKKVVTFSITKEADFFATDIEVGIDYMKFRLHANGEEEVITVNMGGKFNVSNALAAITITASLGIPMKNIKDGLETVKVPGRMEVFQHPLKDAKIVVDYAHNEMSYRALFDSVKEIYPDAKIAFMFGCVTGKAQNRRKIAGEIANELADKIVLTEDGGVPGESNEAVWEEILKHVSPDKDVTIVPIREEAIKHCLDVCEDGWIILMTGWSQEDYILRDGKYVIISDIDCVKEYIENVKKTL